MLEVYNRFFRELWKAKDWRKKFVGTPDNPKWEINEAFGAAGMYAFPKMPGTEHSPEFAYNMRYSKLPTSPEFDAIEWREGRFLLQDDRPQDITTQPMLMAEFDIDNDGNIDTVIKKSFMFDYTTWGGWDGRDGGADDMVIYPKGEYDFTGEVTLHTLNHGQPGRAKPRIVEGLSLRPFILEGVTYLSEYRQVWPTQGARHQQYPTEENMYVLKYRGGGQNLGGGKYTDVDMESICRFRMIAIQ
ncbi:MAG: hypothetical protein ACREYE_22065 [Gammaproteobacteria bacterium]